MKTAIILGTRPEIIKLVPIIEKLTKKNSTIIFTGQHYDYNMSLQFIEELGMRKPDYFLQINKSNPPFQIGQIITKLSKIFSEIKPDTVIVQGDTNTVLAAGISSLKSSIPVNHVEAGLRSFDWRMPEEHNRIAIDHISELLFAPTITARHHLISEKAHGQIFVTGNTVIDSINKYAKYSSKRSTLSIDKSNFALMTLHRSENVDNPQILSTIIKAIINSKQEIIFTVHPRTKKRLKEFDLYEKLATSDKIQLLSSVGYFEMIELMKKCSFIISDSGGIQEEVTSPKIRKKVVIIRKTTDRPEAVKSGYAKLAGISYNKILNSIEFVSKNPLIKSKTFPYGKGDSSKKILSIIKRIYS